MRRAVIIDAVRTPVGRYGGVLRSVRPDDLAALVIREIVRRTGIDPARVDDVYFGDANQAGEDNRNVARMALLLAGLPPTVPGCTVNRLCASGLEAVNLVARLIEAGAGEVFVAGGVESMTRAPLVMLKPENAFQRGDPTVHDTTIGWRFVNARLAELHHPYGMGETAENVAREYDVSREDQDRFAFESQMKCKRAMESGLFDAEILPVTVPQRKGDPVVVDRDEHPRPDTSLEALAKLRPAFAADGTVTAGNASGINDGAAAILVVEAETAGKLGLEPLAVIGPSATAGVDPAFMGMGPVPATTKALERAGMTIDDVEVMELNEAFAAQSLACIRELGIDPARVNPLGGAIALGHPLGCSGARLVTTLVHEMVRRKHRRGVATMCVGVGQGVATVLEGVRK
jgi:3-oxoadipyl-CoA thiolase